MEKQLNKKYFNIASCILVFVFFVQCEKNQKEGNITQSKAKSVDTVLIKGPSGNLILRSIDGDNYVEEENFDSKGNLIKRYTKFKGSGREFTYFYNDRRLIYYQVKDKDTVLFNFNLTSYYNVKPQEYYNIQLGNSLYSMTCKGCHSFNNQSIGPKLMGKVNSKNRDNVIQLINNKNHGGVDLSYLDSNDVNIILDYVMDATHAK